LNARASIAEFLPGLKIAITEIPGHLDEQQLQQQGLLGKIGSKYTGSLHETSDRSWVASAANMCYLWNSIGRAPHESLDERNSVLARISNRCAGNCCQHESCGGAERN
jgi:hypothetical protein